MNNLSGFIHTVDTHTMGEPTRIVLGGFPRLQSDTMNDKKREMENKFDYLRKVLMHEPRGHSDMFGAFITEPYHENCDIGVVFADTGGYLNMCGHGTIGVVTAGISLGIIEKKEDIFLDAPAGKIHCKVTFNGDEVQQVSFDNVPSFPYKRDLQIKVEDIGEVKLDIAYGGNFFAILDVGQLQKTIRPENAQELTDIGMKVRHAVNQQISISHPDNSHINTVDLVEFSEKLDDDYYRNMTVFGDGQIDRSPCGTGTSAKLSLLNLPVGSQIQHDSVIDTYFIAKVIGKVKVSDFDAIISEITGSAWITGFHQFVLDNNDPFPQGFLLS